MNSSTYVEDNTKDDEKKQDLHDESQGEAHGDSHDEHGEGADDQAHQGEHAHEGDHAHEGETKWDLGKSLSFHLHPDHLIGHVQDANYFEWFGFSEDEHGHVAKNHINIPKLPSISGWTAFDRRWRKRHD